MASKQSIKPFKHTSLTQLNTLKKKKTQLNRNKTHSHAQGAVLQVHNMFIFTDH